MSVHARSGRSRRWARWRWGLPQWTSRTNEEAPIEVNGLGRKLWPPTARWNVSRLCNPASSGQTVWRSRSRARLVCSVHAALEDSRIAKQEADSRGLPPQAVDRRLWRQRAASPPANTTAPICIIPCGRPAIRLLSYSNSLSEGRLIKVDSDVGRCPPRLGWVMMGLCPGAAQLKRQSGCLSRPYQDLPMPPSPASRISLQPGWPNPTPLPLPPSSTCAANPTAPP